MDLLIGAAYATNKCWPLHEKMYSSLQFYSLVLGSDELGLQVFFLLPSLIGFCSAHCLYFTTALVIFRVRFLPREGLINVKAPFIVHL